ncbi:TolC family protein [Flavihumibacter sp. CACIAM 22H1]|uniref:TolC family protein n=1 Tax=Flavihumibacter sp. CACIAM 22H1 TaxID=1812911 RepID=UPI0007A8F1FA|nr:TolC family protein [Flavihumibacter sp. CACIAM 22H1]KYP14913.1 MAG: transporter [Flavihumibacter sp. CACIAM 22H1]
MIFFKNTVLFVLLLATITSARAQDTLKITLQQADSLFLQNNFRLLAAAMNVDAVKAEIIQAKLFPNPVFTADLNAYDPQNRKLLHVGKTGQKVFQMEQVIRLAGKRKAEIEMARSNAALAELELVQLTQQLKFQLHSDLFALGQYAQLLRSYTGQLALLDTLLKSYQQQADLGNLPLKDVVRLKGAYLKLNNDRAEVYKDYYEVHANLQVLLQTNSPLVFDFKEEDILRYIKAHPLPDIRTEAQLNRIDLKIAQQNKELADLNQQYQVKLAKPDINVFTSYDQRGGAFNNQINAGLSIPLPFFHRNQGNIKMAEYRVKEADLNVQAVQAEADASLSNAYQSYKQVVTEYKKAAPLYNEDFEITGKGMTENFRKQNVSMIEFIDFFEAYNEVQVELARIKSQLVVSAEKLNLLIGKDMF